MNWTILKDIVSSAAPLLGNALLSPFGGTVGTLIAHAFGCASSDAESIVAAVRNDPEAAIKLRGLELEHEDLLAKLNVTDIQDARKHDSEMEVKGYGWVVPTLALIVVLGFIAVTLFLAFDKVDASEYQILYLMLGQFSAGFTMCLSFYFGSSNNQSKK